VHSITLSGLVGLVGASYVIIVLGLGACLLLRARGADVWAAFALAAALLHTLNHAVFKSLLFLGAGAFERAVGSLEIDRLGGLLRRMPWSGGAFLVGAMAIAGLPPLNGFASEWLTLQALINDAPRTTARERQDRSTPRERHAMSQKFSLNVNGKTHTVGLYGGTILTPGPISDEGLATYLKSVRHFEEETKKAKADTVMQNHPLMYPMNNMLDQLQSRKKGGPNPFIVGQGNYQKFLEVIEICTEVNIARRKT